jgi:glucose/arabinose dehydrogenase
VVSRNIEVPWSVAFLPDGSALVSERDRGRVLQIPAGGGDGRPVGEVEGVDASGEGGLLGLAVSPGFATDRLVYAYITASEDNRVVRMRLDGSRLGPSDVLLSGIAKASIHNGGRIAFGPDGFLYVATGDAAERGTAQDRSSLSGKILRLTAQGRPAPGNPFPNSPVWSYGHRNVQGIAWDSRGRMWASEFGQNAFDELNRIEPGPQLRLAGGRGPEEREGLTAPQVSWATDENSPSGIAVVGDIVYVAGLKGARLWRVPVDGERAERHRTTSPASTAG